MNDASSSRVEEILHELGLEEDEDARMVLNVIEAYPAPAPTAEQSTAVARLAIREGQARVGSGTPLTSGFPERLHEPEIRGHRKPVSIWTLAIAQFEAMGYRGLLLGLAVFAVAFAGIAAVGGGALAVSIVVPIYGAMFLAYSLRADYYGVGEIENVCPLEPGHLMLARIVAAGAADLGAGLLSTAVVTPVSGEPFGMVLISWLAPALLLTGMALSVSLKYGSAAAVAAISCVSALAMLPRGLDTGISPFAPVGPAGMQTHWKLLYAVCGAVLLFLALFRQTRARSAGRDGGEGRNAT
jgi:hypothetical protein